MKVTTMNSIRITGWMHTFLISCLLTACVPAEETKHPGLDLTFFGWSDQHVQTDGSAEHLLPAIDAMNTLPGRPYPPGIGGRVAKPAFVFGCGDITEWPTHAAMTRYNELITKRLTFPAYDVIGNHDEGGKAPSDTMKRWFVSRHRALSYTFTQDGVHFIAVHSKYDETLNNPAQPLTPEALTFIRTSLKKVPEGAPIVIATHLCYDALTNRDDLVNVIGDAHVLAILGGHYHKAKIDHYRGQTFIQLPSPAPGSPPEFTVIRITADRLVVVPYDYGQRKWVDHPKRCLNVSIHRIQARK